MIKYSDLVQYTKDNHINWNADLFDVLRGFFNQYYQLPATTPSISINGITSHSPQQDLFTQTIEFKEPVDGEYIYQDLLNLFNT